jgi:hypothetical protein
MKRLWLAHMSLLATLIFLDVSTPVLCSAEGILVGRIAHIQGELWRHADENEDWVLAVKDSPLGPGDVLYSDENTRAEFIFPGNILIRLGSFSQIEVSHVDIDSIEVLVGSGTTRFYNQGQDAQIRSATPHGYLVAHAETQCDVYVGEDSTEVVSLQGTVRFVYRAKNGYEVAYDVMAGAPSLVARAGNIGAGQGIIDESWRSWNDERDVLLARLVRIRSSYLPESLQADAYVFEEQGRWEQVYYRDGYHSFWRPTDVSAGWSPYTVGRWTVWHGQPIWVPYEPFGYVTHHYGHWVIFGGIWYWAPPAANIGPAHPVLYWHPGRVAWICTESHIGWVPLAPHEDCCEYIPWGHGLDISHQAETCNDYHLGDLLNADHAVLINKQDLYTVKDRYLTVQHRSPIIRQARIDPYLPSTVGKDAKNSEKAHHFVSDEADSGRRAMLIAQEAESLRKRVDRMEPAVSGVSYGKKGAQPISAEGKWSLTAAEPDLAVAQFYEKSELPRSATIKVWHERQQQKQAETLQAWERQGQGKERRDKAFPEPEKGNDRPHYTINSPALNASEQRTAKKDVKPPQPVKSAVSAAEPARGAPGRLIGERRPGLQARLGLQPATQTQSLPQNSEKLDRREQPGAWKQGSQIQQSRRRQQNPRQGPREAEAQMQGQDAETIHPARPVLPPTQARRLAGASLSLPGSDHRNQW